MKIFIDTHAHYYDCYDLSFYLKCCFDNFSAHTAKEESHLCIICLTQSSYKSPSYEQLVKMLKNLNDYEVEDLPEKEIVCVKEKSGNRQVYFIAGKQLISSEKIEILLLTSNQDIAPDQKTIVILNELRSNNNVCILPWSPGKWLFGRGRIVSNLVSTLDNMNLMLGDILIRPHGLPMPAIFRLARSKSIRILAGSDTLPLQGEESGVAAYVSVFSPEEPISISLESVRHLLRQVPFVNKGNRNSIFKAFYRWLKLKLYLFSGVK